MELYEYIKNIHGKNIEEELVKSISSVLSKLNNLTKERMCKVYNSYLLNELRLRHIPSRLINTLDLGLNYEHVFVLIASNNNGYFLADLTFSQFIKESKTFSQLLKSGYQLVDDISINDYLNIVSNRELSTDFLVENIFYSTELFNTKNSSQKK